MHIILHALLHSVIDSLNEHKL